MTNPAKSGAADEILGANPQPDEHPVQRQKLAESAASVPAGEDSLQSQAEREQENAKGSAEAD